MFTTRGPLELVAILVCLTVSVAFPSPTSAEPASWCAGDFAFSLDAPEGWKLRSEQTALGLALSLEPARAGVEPTVAIGVLVPREPAETEELEQVLGDWLGLVGAFGRPLETRPLELAHPELQTRAAQVLHPNGELYMAVARGDGGRCFHVTMARVGGPASASELAALRAVVASLRAEPGVRCGAGPRGAPAAGAP